MTAVRGVADALARLGQAATRLASRRPPGAAEARPAWDAWHAGDFTVAREHAAGLVAAGQAVDEAQHLLALVSCVLGEFDEAIATHQLIDPRYRRLAELDEPILWAHVHLDDIAGAVAFAERRGIDPRGVDAQRLRLALENPLQVAIDGVVDVPFTDDPLTPLMPGFTALLNGRPTVARLDTGGTFVHMTAEVATAFGVKTIVSERVFAALSRHTVRHGFANLELGPIHLRNIPVIVHEGGLQTGPIAAACGVELGPLIGTNVLERFLTTIDAPRRRLVLSPRGDGDARAAHLARIGSTRHEAPFAMWGDHLMIARGRVGGVEDANLFVDSGLVAFTPEQGQAAVLASRGALASWGVGLPAPGRFAELRGPVAIGPAELDGLTAYPIPDSAWRDLGDWGGIRVDALVSWGFLRHFPWTIDFDRRRYLFGDAQDRPA